MAESVNIRFCRLYLQEVEKDVLKHFTKEVLQAAQVGKLYKLSGNQYWEFYVPAIDGLAKSHRVELKASCAYDARALAWAQILKELGLEDKDEGVVIG